MNCKTCAKKMSGKSFHKVTFYEVITKEILEDGVRLTDKTQASGPSNWEFYWMRAIRALYSDGLNIESYC